MKIRKGKLEGFKQQAAVCISQVKEKDPGTLQYDWFLNSDKTECEIREATDHSAVIYGDPSPELMQNATKMKGVGVKTYSSLRGLD